jgi:hypothetical protein
LPGLDVIFYYLRTDKTALLNYVEDYRKLGFKL